MKQKHIEKHFLEECRKNNLTQLETANLLGCSRQLVIKACKQHKVVFQHNKIKNAVNFEFFKNWSYDSAYILGFIMADGCIRLRQRKNKFSYSIKIEIKDTDISVLNFIKERISPTRNIRNITRNQNGINTKSVELILTLDEDTFGYLNTLGLVPRKSGLEKIPNTIPDKYKFAYILGLFDGDGSIYKRKQGGFDWYICSSSESLINQLMEIINWGKIKNTKNMWYITIRDKNGIKRLRELLYKNNSFSLERKRRLMFEIN